MSEKLILKLRSGEAGYWEPLSSAYLSIGNTCEIKDGADLTILKKVYQQRGKHCPFEVVSGKELLEDAPVVDEPPAVDETPKTISEAFSETITALDGNTEPEVEKVEEQVQEELI
jgi:hypothetical protein